MKTSVISKEFRDRYLSNPKSPNAFEGRAIVFDGPEDYHHRIDDPALNIDENCMLFIRGTGPIGYPGGAEVVNMQPPAALIKRGIHALPCIGDGRQSGTSGSPSILNASPEAAAGGGLALLKTGDRVRIDLNKGEANILISDEELAKQRRADLQRPWRLPDPEEPDAVAGDPARHGRPVRRRHGAEAGDQIPATSRRPWESRATTIKPRRRKPDARTGRGRHGYLRSSTESLRGWLGEHELGGEVVARRPSGKSTQDGRGTVPLPSRHLLAVGRDDPRYLPRIGDAPSVLAVGDIHIENFGTWRDEEGRLVWGVNDFDEAAEMPYVLDLVRLATSAALALRNGGSSRFRRSRNCFSTAMPMASKIRSRRSSTARWTGS